jgi:hypothetical protein
MLMYMDNVNDVTKVTCSRQPAELEAGVSVEDERHQVSRCIDVLILHEGLPGRLDQTKGVRLR